MRKIAVPPITAVWAYLRSVILRSDGAEALCTDRVVSASVSSIPSPVKAARLKPPSAVFFKKSLRLDPVIGLSISACRCWA